MREDESSILETFGKLLPELTEQDKARLMAFGEGLAFQLEDRRRETDE